MNIDFSSGGPLVSGKLAKGIEDARKSVEQDLGDRAVYLVQDAMSRSIRHRTGHLERAVRSTMRQGSLVVTADSVVYSAWIEGVSSRNKSSRFKGYANFRKATHRLQQEAGNLADDTIRVELSRLR